MMQVAVKRDGGEQPPPFARPHRLTVHQPCLDQMRVRLAIGEEHEQKCAPRDAPPVED